MKPPRYVKFAPGQKYCHPCCLRLYKNEFVRSDLRQREYDVYYRDAGCWEVKFKIVDGRIFIDEPSPDYPAHHLHGMELLKCSKDEWKTDNGSYV